MRSSMLVTSLLLAASACGDDGGDDVQDFDAPTDAAPADGAIDANVVDARVIDAMPDTPGPPTVNDCTEAAALDRTELADQREVIFPGSAYAPKCMKIRVGQTVTWAGDLTAHPLRPGIIVGGVRMAQAGNPIPPTSSGDFVSVNFTAAGTYGFYCNIHWAGGMKGAIYVVP